MIVTRRTRRTLFAAFILAYSLSLPGLADDDRNGDQLISNSESPACRSLTPAALGGSLPPRSLIALRWLGTANFEIAYDNQVILLDAYYDRGPRNRPIGFTPDQVTRADAIFIGHGHFDHMSDAVQVAGQTGAPVIGAPTTIDKALADGLAPRQAITVRGGELLHFPGYTVEAILARHSTLIPSVLGAFMSAIRTTIGAPTPAEAAAEAAIGARGTSDPRVITEGTIAYLFTFDTGFRLIYRDSAGPITDAERAALARIGGNTDAAIVAYIGQYVAEPQIAATLPLIQLYNPRLYLPAHHDEIAGLFLDIGTEPLFLAIRDEVPKTKALSPLYREPVCINIAKDSDEDRD
jgi:L-ascorbate metabolism protein UlaG (beta-lactamase superfamily)